MQQYWVIGGKFSDTNFNQLAPGETEVREGPFDNYDAALKVWQRLAWQTVDDALAHFHIDQEDLSEQLTEPAYWVVGGQFTDTSFTNWASPPERFGPYKNREAAEKQWQELAWRTVDDATTMYRIEKLDPAVSADAEAPAKLAYRLLTGEDNQAFCERVSAALEDGYALYGSPAITVTADGSKRFVSQAVVLDEDDWD